MTDRGLGKVYTIDSAAAARAFYDGWAEGYEAELADGGYVTPQRAAQALAEFATNPAAPLADFGCGTGLSGLALKAAGFDTLDGYDISDEMLKQARAKNIYRATYALDMSYGFGNLPARDYGNAAAIGVINTNFMPPTVIDEMIGILPSGGCLVMTLNDHSMADGTMETRLLELTEYNIADLMFKDYGPHIPEIGLQSTVYVLKKR